MSFKGVQKFAHRAPQQFRNLVHLSGKDAVTKDAVYEDAEARFKRLVEEVTKLHKQSEMYAETVKKMLSCQMQFSKALGGIFNPISGSPSDPHACKDPGHPEGQVACKQYEAIIKDLQDTIYPQIDEIDTRIIAPTALLLTHTKEIRKTLEKRNRKLQDFDRFRLAVDGLQAKKDKDPKDEDKLAKAKIDFDDASVIFEEINTRVNKDLPVFFDLEREIIEPLFTILYFIQLNVFWTMEQRMQNLNIPYLDLSTDIEEGFQKKMATVEDPSTNLSILRFKTTGYKSLLSPKPTVSKSAEAAEARRRLGYGDASSSSDPAASPPPPYTAKVQEPQHPISAVTSPTYSHLGAAAKAKVAPPPPKPKPSKFSVPGGTEYARALYDYEAQANTDLSFKANDTIEIVKRTPNSNEWWTGKIGIRTGQFPGNYVEIVENH